MLRGLVSLMVVLTDCERCDGRYACQRCGGPISKACRSRLGRRA